MQIKLAGKRGRANIESTIDVSSLSTEEDLQEFLISVLDFAIAMGAELPEEILGYSLVQRSAESVGLTSRLHVHYVWVSTTT